jgi:hypothetical protein
MLESTDTGTPGSLSSLLVSSLNLYVKVESGIVDLLLILAAVASRNDRLPGRTSNRRSNCDAPKGGNRYDFIETLQFIAFELLKPTTIPFSSVPFYST